MNHSVQRGAILEALRASKSHPTAEELHRELRPRYSRLSLATVYRDLEQLAAAGVILKLDCGGKVRRFDGEVRPHAHLRCPECGSLRDLDHERIQELHSALVGLLPELHCTGVNLEFTARCPKCQSPKRRSPNDENT